MKDALRLIGIIAIVAVIGFSFASCKEDGGGGGDDNTPKTLVITGITSAQYTEGTDYFHAVGIFPSGTSTNNVLNQTGVVAGAYSTYSGVSIAGSGSNYTLTAPLYTYTNIRWTGSGTYDVYLVFLKGSLETYYKASVSFSSATTTVAASSFSTVTL